jgi:hypothetical protein
MAKIDWDRIPKFAQLPIKPEAPPQSSCGVFGDDDQLGCLNFLTPEGVIGAAAKVRKGSVFRLDAAIGFAVPPSIREPVKQTIRNYFDVGFSARCARMKSLTTRTRCAMSASSSDEHVVPAEQGAPDECAGQRGVLFLDSHGADPG